MIHTNARFSSEVEAAVAAIELRTSAEVVVVAAERSGSYADLTAIFAASFAWLAAAAMVWAPFHLAPHWFMVDLGVAFGLGWWIGKQRWAIRLMSSRQRRWDQVRASASQEFTQESVHGTPLRTGVLVYVSALEEKVELIPDAGVEARIPPGRWVPTMLAFSHADLDHFLSGLNEVGDVLAAHFPADDIDNFNLPDAPRIRT